MMVGLLRPCYMRSPQHPKVQPKGNDAMTDYSRASWVDPSLNWNPLPVSELPERVLIDYATKCNLRCPMCPVWGSEDNDAIDSVKGIMNADSSLRLLDEIAPGRPL